MSDPQFFAVVVDETPECLKALRFAARRAQKTGRGVVMLYIVEPDSFQHWQVVADAMRAEAYEAAEQRLQALAADVKALNGLAPDYLILEGGKRDSVLEYIRDRRKACLLVLGAGVEGEGPGPLVSALTGDLAGRLPIPVTLVPGGMTLEEIDAVC